MLNLLPRTTDTGRPDFAWMYTHATLLRLFRTQWTGNISDRRVDLFGQVPGLQRVHAYPGTLTLGVPGTSIFLDSFALEFADCVVVCLGGTRLLGWPHHIVNAMSENTAGNGYFSTFWWDLATEIRQDVETFLGAGDTRPIVWCGHSLGGATAIAAAYQDYDRLPFRRQYALTFGAPKARQAPGMDGKAITLWRVQNEHDIVPHMPFNPLPLRLLSLPFKLATAFYEHAGLAVQLNDDGDTIDASSYGSPLWQAPLFYFPSFGMDWQIDVFPLWQHYMDTYVRRLRSIVRRKGVSFDPFCDKVNGYLNDAEGETWRIPGFPVQAPPALPPGYVSPPVVDVEAKALEAAEEIKLASSDLLNPLPGLVTIPGQTFAPSLSLAAGRPYVDVSIELLKAPVPDDEDITPDTLDFADFDGYLPHAGPMWTTETLRPGLTTPRYQTRAAFYYRGGEPGNTIHAWAMLAHRGGGAPPDVVHVERFGRPLTLDRPRTIVIRPIVVAVPV